jgi:predicted RNA-binding Zn-ribbon protein involved in translation (DUF1610 family)
VNLWSNELDGNTVCEECGGIIEKTGSPQIECPTCASVIILESDASSALENFLVRSFNHLKPYILLCIGVGFAALIVFGLFLDMDDGVLEVSFRFIEEPFLFHYVSDKYSFVLLIFFVLLAAAKYLYDAISIYFKRAGNRSKIANSKRMLVAKARRTLIDNNHIEAIHMMEQAAKHGKLTNEEKLILRLAKNRSNNEIRRKNEEI